MLKVVFLAHKKRVYLGGTMGKVAIVTDSNSGITQKEGKELGVYVLPMPFYIDEKLYYEEIDLSQEQFYELLKDDKDIKTSSPIIGEVADLWDRLLTEYDEIVHIPMSSGLSGSCQAAAVLADDYEGRVQVVDNQRISVTMRRSVIDAKNLSEQGKSAFEIKKILEKEKLEASIYIMVDTLYYLKKGGRITPAAAALGTMLKLKPVLQIQGQKLDAYAKARSVKQAKEMIISAIRKDFTTRFKQPDGMNMYLDIAYSYDREAAEEFAMEVAEEFPGHIETVIHPLSLSVSCHIGPGALAVAISHRI